MKTILPHKRMLLMLGVTLCILQGFSASAQTIDTRFNLPKPYVRGYVESMTETSDRRVIVAGDFDYLNGKPADKLVKLTSRGTADPGFRPDVDDFYPEKVIAMRDGRILVLDSWEGAVMVLNRSGRFVQWIDLWADDVWVTKDNTVFIYYDEELFKLNSDFTVDQSFGDGGSMWFDGDVRDVDYHGGSYFIAGDFYTEQYMNEEWYDGYDLVKVTEGAIDNSFDFGSGSEYDGVGSVEVLPDGTLLLGNAYYDWVNGSYVEEMLPHVDTDGSVSEFNDWYFGDIGEVMVRGSRVIVVSDGEEINRFRLDGSYDDEFEEPEFDYGTDGMLVLAMSGGDVVVGNAYNTLDDMGMASFNARGVRNATFKPALAADGYYTGLIKSGTSYIVTGWFHRLGNEPANLIARVRSNFTVDRSFKVTNNFGWVYQPQLFPDGKVLIWSDWYGLVKLNLDGSWDGSFSLDTSWPLWSIWGSDVKLMPDGKILIMSSYGIVRRNANGSADGTFTSQQFNAYDSYWNDFAVQSDGKIIVGGYFTTLNGTPIPKIARLNVNGTIDGTFVSSAPDYYIKSISVAKNDEVLVKGGFYFWGPDRITYGWSDAVVKLSPDGARDASFNSNYYGNGFYSDYGYQEPIGFRNGFIMHTNWGIIYVNVDGTVDENFWPENTYVSGIEQAFAVNDQTLLVAGSIYVNDIWRSAAKFNFPPVPVIVPELEGPAPSARMAVYPNPSADYISIESTSKVKLMVMSLDGSIKLSKEINATDDKIDVRHLEPGRYVIKMMVDGKMITQHMVKE